MAEAIGPGTALICIAKSSNPYTWSNKLTLQALYFCREVTQHKYNELCTTDACGTVGLRLKNRKGMYCPNLFRPLNDGDTSLVQDEIEAPDGITEELINV